MAQGNKQLLHAPASTLAPEFECNHDVRIEDTGLASFQSIIRERGLRRNFQDSMHACMQQHSMAAPRACSPSAPEAPCTCRRRCGAESGSRGGSCSHSQLDRVLTAPLLQLCHQLRNTLNACVHSGHASPPWCAAVHGYCLLTQARPGRNV
jgi:hypothetical protein